MEEERYRNHDAVLFSKTHQLSSGPPLNYLVPHLHCLEPPLNYLGQPLNLRLRDRAFTSASRLSLQLRRRLGGILS